MDLKQNRFEVKLNMQKVWDSNNYSTIKFLLIGLEFMLATDHLRAATTLIFYSNQSHKLWQLTFCPKTTISAKTIEKIIYVFPIIFPSPSPSMRCWFSVNMIPCVVEVDGEVLRRLVSLFEAVVLFNVKKILNMCNKVDIKSLLHLSYKVIINLVLLPVWSTVLHRVYTRCRTWLTGWHSWWNHRQQVWLE